MKALRDYFALAESQPTSATLLKSFQICRQFSNFLKVFRLLESFQVCKRFSDFGKFSDLFVLHLFQRNHKRISFQKCFSIPSFFCLLLPTTASRIIVNKYLKVNKNLCYTPLCDNWCIKSSQIVNFWSTLTGFVTIANLRSFLTDVDYCYNI